MQFCLLISSSSLPYLQNRVTCFFSYEGVRVYCLFSFFRLLWPRPHRLWSPLSTNQWGVAVYLFVCPSVVRAKGFPILDDTHTTKLIIFYLSVLFLLASNQANERTFQEIKVIWPSKPGLKERRKAGQSTRKALNINNRRD